MSMNAPETMGVIYRLQLSQLHPHPQNPFSIRDDQAMLDLIQSVQSHGVLVPAIARPRPDGEYEIIAGHRRKHASELAGLDFMPVVVLDLNDDEAIIQLVDSNIQRENILPSERAKAYKMRMEAMKRQGARTDLTSPNISARFRSDDELGQEVGVSGDTIRNYASLTNLVPELMQMVDEGRIKLSPAYQIAALPHNEQALPENVENHIHERGTKKQPLTEEQKANNRIKSKTRCRIEHIFGFMTGSMHGITVRSVGLARAEFNIGLTNLIYNFCRFEFLNRSIKAMG